MSATYVIAVEHEAYCVINVSDSGRWFERQPTLPDVDSVYNL